MGSIAGGTLKTPSNLVTLIGIPISAVRTIPQSNAPLTLSTSITAVITKEMAIIVFTFLFVDLFNCIGTVIGVIERAGMVKDGKIPRLKEIFMTDSLATTLGAIMGTSTVAVYVESATGVNEGGRSGLTAFITGVCFLVALFFAPLFLAIPAAATAPVLVLVGLMMMGAVVKIDFNNYAESVPAFICVIMMPLTYSISDGIVLGHLSYIFINLCSGNYRKITMGMYVLAAFFVLKFIM